jgi:hypothetical protein
LCSGAVGWQVWSDKYLVGSIKKFTGITPAD